MPVKVINGKNISVTFRKGKIKQLFMKLCEKAPKVSVDWDRFRELDKHGLFEDFSNAQLSMRFRNLSLREQGICWQCGKEEATENNGMCNNCGESFKIYLKKGRQVVKSK